MTVTTTDEQQLTVTFTKRTWLGLAIAVVMGVSGAIMGGFKVRSDVLTEIRTELGERLTMEIGEVNVKIDRETTNRYEQIKALRDENRKTLELIEALREKDNQTLKEIQARLAVVAEGVSYLRGRSEPINRKE